MNSDECEDAVDEDSDVAEACETLQNGESALVPCEMGRISDTDMGA